MEPQGQKIAQGRDSEIFDHGHGRVLRRSFVPRDLTNEARLMTHVREHGYPAPEVFDAGFGYIVMERIFGLELLQFMPRTPGGVRGAGQVLAGLQAKLAAIPAPDWLPPAPGDPGDSIVHLDLHPMNVMVTRDLTDMVIDWGNAKRGRPETDVANTWLLLKAGQPPGSRLDRFVVGAARGMMLRAFLKNSDRDAAARQIAAVAEWRAADRNMSPAEIARMRKLVASVT